MPCIAPAEFFAIARGGIKPHHHHRAISKKKPGAPRSRQAPRPIGSPQRWLSAGPRHHPTKQRAALNSSFVYDMREYITTPPASFTARPWRRPPRPRPRSGTAARASRAGRAARAAGTSTAARASAGTPRACASAPRLPARGGRGGARVGKGMAGRTGVRGQRRRGRTGVRGQGGGSAGDTDASAGAPRTDVIELLERALLRLGDEEEYHREREHVHRPARGQCARGPERGGRTRRSRTRPAR